MKPSSQFCRPSCLAILEAGQEPIIASGNWRRVEGSDFAACETEHV